MRIVPDGIVPVGARDLAALDEVAVAEEHGRLARSASMRVV